LLSSAWFRATYHTYAVAEIVTGYGYPESAIVLIVIAECALVVLYLVRQTSVLAAILMTGYLGGAVATHLRIADTARAAIPLVVGILAWGGLYLRDSRIRDIVPFPRSASGASQDQSASELISKRIAKLGDWRGETLSRMRALIKEADPDVVEELKWVKPTNPGTPTWSHDGIICTGECYKNVVKLTFAKGASLKDPARLFNSSLDGNVRRAIDIHEGDEVDESAFKALVRQAVTLNRPGKSKPSKQGEARRGHTKGAAVTGKRCPPTRSKAPLVAAKHVRSDSGRPCAL